MDYDFIVIGAGISGASAAFELLKLGTVVLIEAENAPGYHATGRSAALYTPHFGSSIVRRISKASFEFLASPKPDFCPSKILNLRGMLTIAGPGKDAFLEKMIFEALEDDSIIKLSPEEVLIKAPLLRPELVHGAVYEPGVMDIEVASLHQAYLASFKRQGGTLHCNVRVEVINRFGGSWQIKSRSQEFTGRVIINAAGAWADEIAGLAGADTIGIIPKRRTAIIVDPPVGVEVAALPAIDFAGSDAYLKPDAGKIMASFGDATPVTAQDVQPEELDLAILANWLQINTLIKVRRIKQSWAGLRSFVRDEDPVVGYDPKVPDFFWLAGQGGYGIMMAPALASATACLINSEDLDESLKSFGITKMDIAPDRFLR